MNLRLKARRLNAGLSIEALSERTGIGVGSLYYYESSGGMPRDPAQAKAIADVFGLKVTDLWTLESGEVAA